MNTPVIVETPQTPTLIVSETINVERIMSLKFLKVKIKSLAAEATIIRLEERKSFGAIRRGLHEHRVNDVRKECRAAQLAYGFLRGRSYRSMEAKHHEAPKWARVEALIKKYGVDEDPRDVAQRFEGWKSA